MIFANEYGSVDFWKEVNIPNLKKVAVTLSAGTDSALSISTTRVGVGTAAPESALHIDGDAGNVNAKIIVGETNEKFITFGLVSGSDPAYIATDNARELAFGSMTNDHDVAFASEWMRIDNSGKVGIGEINPNNKLAFQTTIAMLEELRK